MSSGEWDTRYSTPDYVYGISPNEYFRACLSKLEPGRLLLPAEGEGRNAVWAATTGWEVSAFDQSEEGRKKAVRLAADKGVEIDYRIFDLGNPQYPEMSFDAMALIFAHTNESIRRAVHRNLIRFLKPGGHLILEAYSKDQMKFFTGGPKDPGLLFSLADLETDFDSFEILESGIHEVLLDEGSLHKGISSVIRIQAKKIK
jgi:SAM-dependent methyltransferase